MDRLLNGPMIMRKIGKEFAVLFGSSSVPAKQMPLFFRRPLRGGSPVVSHDQRCEADSSGNAYEEFVKISDALWLIKVHGVDTCARSEVYIGEDLFKIHFRLKGASKIQFPAKDAVDLRGPICGVMLHPDGIEKYEQALGGEEAWITIFCKPEILSDVLDLPPSRLPADFKAFLSGGAASLYNRQLPLTPAMSLGARALFSDPPFEGLKRTFTEAKTLDLLCQVMLLLTRGKPSTQSVVLSARDRNKLHEIKECLDINYASPPSLSELAAQAGMNQNKLVVGFRELFSMSINEYCLSARMNTAIDLLVKGDLSITEAGAAVGYKYPGNFTAAFKRHFGISPKEARYRN